MTEVFNTRPALDDDLDQLMDIERLCFPGPTAYTRRQIRHLAFKANSSCIIAEEKGKVAGFIIVLFREGSGVAGVETIEVHPEFRGRGLGKILLEAGEKEMVRKGRPLSRLEVAESNRAAVSLYEQFGYKVARHMTNYYQFDHGGTRNALQMVKNL